MGLELINKEVITGEEAKEELIEGIEDLANAVLVTMGPMGKTVIISDEYGKPYVTKDGVSVANAVKFHNPYKNIGATLIKEVAQKTADEAGDGTTTSICLAQQFINSGLEVLSNESNIIDLQREIDALVVDTVKLLKKGSKKLRKRDIHKVAAISANNNKEIGKLIQKAYNHSSVVKVEEGKQKDTEIEIVDGMTLPVSFMSPTFINNERKQEVNYDEAAVLILDKKLESLEPLKVVMQQCASNNKPLVIFSEFVAEGALKLLEANSINGYLKVVVIKSPGFGAYRKQSLQDIAKFTGATVIANTNNDMLGTGVLGKAVNITVGKTETIIGKPTNINVDTLITELKDSLATAKISDYDKEFLQTRIDRLEGKMAVIRVGGTSEIEMKETKDRIDDAVLAVKSALEEGIVEGGGLALSRIYNVLSGEESSDIRRTLLSVLLAPAFKLHENSHGKICFTDSDNNFKNNIIDPLKVTRCAFENAASVAKTILSTETIVLNQGLWR